MISKFFPRVIPSKCTNMENKTIPSPTNSLGGGGNVHNHPSNLYCDNSISQKKEISDSSPYLQNV